MPAEPDPEPPCTFAGVPALLAALGLDDAGAQATSSEAPDRNATRPKWHALLERECTVIVGEGSASKGPKGTEAGARVAVITT